MIYVVRHGQVPSNVLGIISGWNDETLTEKGIEQAELVRDELKEINFDAVYSSPIKGAVQTAEIIVPDKEIICDARLAERDPGTLLGNPRKMVNKDEWNSLEFDRTKDGAETLAAGLKRVRNFINYIDNLEDMHDILIVTHNFISKCIWMIEDNVTDKEQINNFVHKNGQILTYRNR